MTASKTEVRDEASLNGSMDPHTGRYDATLHRLAFHRTFNLSLSSSVDTTSNSLILQVLLLQVL